MMGGSAEPYHCPCSQPIGTGQKASSALVGGEPGDRQSADTCWPVPLDSSRRGARMGAGHDDVRPRVGKPAWHEHWPRAELLGLGLMGAPMASRLLAGHGLAVLRTIVNDHAGSAT